LLTTGQLVRHPLGLAVQADHLEDFRNDLDDGPLGFVDNLECEGDVLADGLVTQQAEVLEDTAIVRRSLGTCRLLMVLSVLPLTMTVPVVGLSSLRISRRQVDLPDPDGPIRKTNSPFSISMLTLSSAGRVLAG